MQGVNYHRHVDSVDHREGLHHTGCDDGQSNKSHREIHFAFLPERYKPLVDEEERIRAKEQKKKKKKEQYKKVRKLVGPFLCKRMRGNGVHRRFPCPCGAIVLKHLERNNVGKALRATWKCLMLGFYNFALGYSTPITVAATFVPDFHPGRNTR